MPNLTLKNGAGNAGCLTAPEASRAYVDALFEGRRKNNNAVSIRCFHMSGLSKAAHMAAGPE